MHPKQLIGLSKLFYNSFKDSSLYSVAIFGFNFASLSINRKLSRNKDYRSPNFLGLEITNYCTKNCKGCYVPEEMRKDKTIVDEKLLSSAIYQAKKLGIRDFGFFGGEPINEDTVPVALKATSENPFLGFLCCTNGEYIARNDVSFFKDSPNIGFCLSIDGFEKTNDNIRGKGSYSDIMDASKQLKYLKSLFSAFVTVRKENFDEALSEDFVNHLIDRDFKYIMWGRYNNPDYKDPEVADEDFSRKLKELREKTMTKQLFQNADLVGDFFSFNGRNAQYTNYMCVNGDMRIEREDMSETIGNLNEKGMREILGDNLEKYSEKYSYNFTNPL